MHDFRAFSRLKMGLKVAVFRPASKKAKLNGHKTRIYARRVQNIGSRPLKLFLNFVLEKKNLTLKKKFQQSFFNNFL